MVQEPQLRVVALTMAPEVKRNVCQRVFSCFLIGYGIYNQTNYTLLKYCAFQFIQMENAMLPLRVTKCAFLVKEEEECVRVA